MGGVSLVNGWLPWVIYVLAPATVVLSVSWRDGRWRRELLWGVPIGLGLVVVASIANDVFDLIPYSFPESFYAFVGLAAFALTVAVVSYRTDRVWRRLDSFLAVVACVALLGVVVNGHYQYFPTVANVFGKVTDNELALPQLVEIKTEVEKTGTLPTNGYIVHTAIPGTVSGFPARDGYIYFPPAYFAKEAPKLPVLLMLHGTPGGPEDWLVGGQAAQVADAFAAMHEGKAPILVMADATGGDTADTECVNGGHGQSETYLTTDVPNFVNKTFGTTPGARSWGVAGLSMGGYCALMLELRHPDLFGVFGDYSGLDRPELDPPENALADLFGGNQQTMDGYEPVKILRAKSFPGLAGWFEVGTSDDGPLKATQQIAPLAEKAGITTCVLIRPGGHDFGFWHQAFEDSLPWMSARLGLVPMPVDTHGADCTHS